MKKLINIHLILPLALLIGIGSNLHAQQNMPMADLLIGDSIRVQTKLGLFYYGFFAGSNDSIMKYSYTPELNNIQGLKIKQVAEIVLLARIVPVMIEKEAQTSSNKTNRQELTEPNRQERQEIKSYQEYEETIPKNRRQTAQILAGAGSGYLGAIAGGLVGFYIGDEIVGGWDSDIYGTIIGVFAGSVLLNAVTVQQIGNTNEVKGNFLPTLAGTTIGMIAGIFVYPISPFVAAAGGVLAFNKSRKKVADLEQYRLVPKQ